MTRLVFVPNDHPDLLLLTQALDRFFLERYGPATRKYQKHHDLTRMACAAVAYVDGTPAACCCWRPIDPDTAEIKRMFVQPSFRRTGLARQLLEIIERHAAAAGCCRAVLETGSDMDQAIAAYRHMGYLICENFGEFAGDWQVACMEKEISSVSGRGALPNGHN